MPVNYFPPLAEKLTWGDIQGAIELQEDLLLILNSKADADHSHLPQEVGLSNVTNDKQIKDSQLEQKLTFDKAKVPSSYAVQEPVDLFPGYLFNGIDSHIEIAHDPKLSFTNGSFDLPFTIAALYTPLAGNSYHHIAAKYDLGAEYTLFIDSTGNVTFRLYSASFANFIEISATNAATEAEKSYFIAGVYDGSGTAAGLKIYVNGIEYTDNPITNNYAGMAISASPLKLGALASFHMKGLLSAVLIFDKELSAASIRNLCPKGLFCHHSIDELGINNPVLSLDSQNANPQVWIDASSNELHGICNNTVPVNRGRAIICSIAKGISSDSELDDMISGGYVIEAVYIKVQQGGSAGKNVNIGISAGGSELTAAFELGSNITYELIPQQKIFTVGANIFINDNSTLTAWDSGTQLIFDISINMKRLV